MKSNFFNKNSAQGTIEYLVIIAVVVVVSLIVVGLFVNITSSPSQQILDSSRKLGSTTSGGISIVEAVIDLNGNALVKLDNLSSDNVSLVKISAGGVDTDPLNNQMYSLVRGVDFNLNNLLGVCPCVSGQKSVSCDLVVEYTIPPYTVIHTFRETINASCVSEVKAVNPDKVVQPVVPVLELGTLENPWIINDCNELQNMNLHLDGYYILGNDIECGVSPFNTGDGFQPIGLNYENPFIGGFDGQNHTISNLFINTPLLDNTGLFGNCQGEIKNVILSNVSVTGGYDVGGLVGIGYSSVSNSSVTGNITGYQNVGGLVGFNNDQVNNSFFTGTVQGANYIGGLVGTNFGGSIYNSFSNGPVTGSGGGIGGLVGFNMGYIFDSYSTGLVSGISYVGGFVGDNAGSVSNSFYDNETSNQSDNDGRGVPKATLDMKTAYTFTSVNWSTDIWNLVDGAYPSLKD